MSKLLIIGAGRMATAVAGGMLNSGVFSPGEICAFDVSPSSAEKFTEATGISCETEDCRSLAVRAERILLAVKPQTLQAALAGVKDVLAGKLIVSLLAGVTIEKLIAFSGSEEVVRVMPNTPSLIGEGASAFAVAPAVKPEGIELTERIFGSVGIVIRTREEYLDAVTALSGSGPAYVFTFIQALIDGAVAAGLPREDASRLTLQTVIGSAEMVRQTGMHPVQLRDQVTSPAGTTIRAMQVLEERGFSGSVIQAVVAAAERSRELGK